MLELFGDNLVDLMNRGGVVMWPLLAMSVLGVTLCLERMWFWLSTNRPGRREELGRLARLLRQGDHEKAMQLVAKDRSVYGKMVVQLLDEPVTDALVVDVVESQRPRLERFMPTLSTIITAAPMLGILGTVLGIISSFEVIGQAGSAGDPSLVSQGIAEALLTTAAGLIVALLVLIPYNLFRSQVDRTLGRIETLVAAIQGPRTIEKSKD
ncbi:MAG: flagellar motor protein MotA [Phycisphaeraceae bacterium]|nr:flagellar motor protein MotA [Phycisphaeraceae bacterium]